MARGDKNFSSIDSGTATRLLDRYRPVVRALVLVYPQFARDDLLSVGDEAILEGFMSLDPARASEGHWIRRIVSWRLQEAAQQGASRVPTTQLEESRVRDGHDTEREVLQNLALRVIGTLSPRHQAILVGRLRDETLEEIADSLGISTAHIHREYHMALKLLRKAMEKR